jgi:hypothetical protein
MAKLFCVGSLVLIVVIAGCGGSGGGGSTFGASNATVTVSPATVKIPTSDQVTLQATVKGTSNDANASVSWTIEELKTNGASGAQCNWLGTTPPAGPCPDGTIQGADANSLTVTYHAPSSLGTFHVDAETIVSLSPSILKDGTSVITVGP